MNYEVIIPWGLFVTSMCVTFYIKGKETQHDKMIATLSSGLEQLGKKLVDEIRTIERKLLTKEDIDNKIDNRVMRHETEHHTKKK
jgi:hypothetical protein